MYFARKLRVRVASVCLTAFVAGMVPAHASAFDESTRAIQLLDGQTCAQRMHDVVTVAQDAVASPTAEPSAPATPLGRPANGPSTIYVTPPPQGGATAPPVPTATPSPSSGNQPIYIFRNPEPAPSIAPAGHYVAPSPAPSAAATLAPGFVAVIADKVNFNKAPGKPGDAYGNVHIFYSTGELVGDHAHYDGLRTITVTGSPYVINRARDSILEGTEIDFDTIDQSAVITKAYATSAEGVDNGLIHFSSPDLHTDPDGIGHGTNVFLTTCENSRGGYHVTGKHVTYYPGDKIVITDAILWLGAAAIFFLPRIVIPLRTADNNETHTSYFPLVGYNSYQGAYIKVNYGFGKTRYYYGYYRLEYYTKQGLGLGYTGYFAKRNGRRTASVSYYGLHDRSTNSTTHNLAITEVENISPTLHGNFAFNYTGNYGALTDIPPSTTLNLIVAHNGARSQQQYSFVRNATGSQSQSNTFSVTDNRQITRHLRQVETFSLSNSDSNISGTSISNTNSHFNSVTDYTTTGADYQLTVDKTFESLPTGVLDKLPELHVTPYNFFKHFAFPISASFTVGEYAEPGALAGYVPATSRADMAFVLGPALYRIWGSTFSAQANVTQFAYGTGDLKAAISQVMSLNTPIGKHILNTVSYNEFNYNGPGIVPFQLLDQQSTNNGKNAQDTIRFFNGGVYNFTLNYSTNFSGQAQPISYQFNAQPSPRSVVILGGSFNPGSGLGFQPTQVQFLTPLGYETTVAFAGQVDWQNHMRIENKNIYISKIIGECYELRVNYIQASTIVNVEINLLAFPSRGANFGVGQGGSIIPGSLNY
jgi:hypothetical protein